MVNKALGQHWLYNRAILDEIAKIASEGTVAACPSDSSSHAAQAKSSRSAEHIAATPSLAVEIGPGLGTLTSSLLRRFDKVVAVEFDADLARKLPGSFPGKNLEVINEDFLKFDLSSVPAPYVVAGNIPYYITSPIIEHILMSENRPKRAVLLMQKEVAERVVNDKRESVLSLRCKNRADVSLGPVVLRNEFTPPPKVDSQVLILEPHEPLVPDGVFKIIGMGFSAPRKKLIHNLASLRSKSELVDIFIKCNINIDARPSDLKLEDWYKIYQKMI